MIATDLDNFFFKANQSQDDVDYTLVIYGPCEKPELAKSESGNDAVEMIGYAPLRSRLAQKDSKIVEIRVTKVRLPL